MKSKLLITTLAVCSLALTGCGSSTSGAPASEPGSSGTDGGSDGTAKVGVEPGWTQEYSGTSLSILADSTRITRIIQTLLPTFKAETGIDVKWEMAPYDSLVQKATLDFSSGNARYDVIDAPSEYLGSFVSNEYIAPLDSLHDEDLSGAAPSYSRKDIIPKLWETASNWAGRWYGVPSNSAVMMMMYRSDLYSNAEEKRAFKKKFGYDLRPAQTFDQYIDIAKFFTRPAGAKLAGVTLKEPFYGVAMTGKRHEATTLEWLCYLWAYGGTIFNKNGMPALDSDASISATSYMKELAQFAQAGSSSATWDEVNSTLQQGNAAQALQWSDLAGGLEDPSASKVAGKIGYANIPTVEKNEKSIANAGPWTWVVNADSEKVEAAKLFMAWTLSKPIQLAISEQGGVPSTRTGYKNKDLMAQKPYWSQIYTSLTLSKERPRIAEWGSISGMIAENLSSLLSGHGSASSAMKSANASLQTLMKGKLPVRQR